MRLRLATFNIRNGRAFDGWHSWPFRRRAALAAIRALDADVVGLQEAFRFQLSWLDRQLSTYAALGAGRDDGRRGERTALLVRRGSLVITHERTRWFGDEPDRPGTRLPGAGFPRTVTIATITAPDGARVQVANTHLDERSAVRRVHSIKQLVAWLDPEVPRVVLGDLNTEPDDRIFDILAAAGLHRAAPTPDGGTNHDFTGRRDGRRLDHVLVSPGVSIRGAAVVYGSGRLPSDHWPVVVDIEVTP